LLGCEAPVESFVIKIKSIVDKNRKVELTGKSFQPKK